MITLQVIVIIFLGVCLVLLSALPIMRSRHSQFELKRRGDDALLHRELLLDDIFAYRRSLVAMIIVLMTAVTLGLYGWWGVLVTFLILLIAVSIARLKSVQNISRRIYSAQERRLLSFAGSAPTVGWLLGSKRQKPHDSALESSEQLLHLVETAGHILTDDQQTIIRNGLAWHGIAVSEVMTPRKRIQSVKYTELLGPLVLDDLHRSGHTRFPVIKGTIDVVVGVLDVTGLLQITAGKSSPKVEDVMSPQVLRIEESETLPKALSVLQKSHEHLLIVVDGEGKTTGIITLSDIMASLLGKNRGEVV